MTKPPTEDDVLRRMLKTPPKPFTPTAKKKPSPRKAKAISTVDQLKQLNRDLLAVKGLSDGAVAERERIQRRMCELQGMNFDAPDGLHEND